jgi:hypothetical protein
MQRDAVKAHKEFNPYITSQGDDGHSDPPSLEKEIYDVRYEQTKRGLYPDAQI